MATTTKRANRPALSQAEEQILAQYEQRLRPEEDLTASTIRRNYLSDLCHFVAWFETEREANIHGDVTFTPQAITTPALMRCRSYLQMLQGQNPVSVNRSLINLKRYFEWVTQQHLITYDPSVAVKLVGQEASTPRHLDDQEERSWVAVVTKVGTFRDRVLIVLLLHTGLRAREVFRLRGDQMKLGKRSGFLEIVRKRNKYREFPLNATARKTLEEYLATFPATTAFLFPSGKTKGVLSEQALSYIVKKYAQAAKLPDVSLHDLRHRFGYRVAESVALHRLAQIMGHDLLDTTMLYIQGTKHDLQQAVETISWT